MTIIKISLAILSILFGFPILAKIAYAFWRYQFWIGSFSFNMKSWRDEDLTMFGIAGIITTSIIILCWLAYFFPDKKE
ncbi:MAG: hypothetical protein AABY22_26745 [Nanoarchaeota archaeon]